MQIGVRWVAGAKPHATVPVALHDAVIAAELRHPEAKSWVLTWLEGRPVLTLDATCQVTQNLHGEVRYAEIAEQIPEWQDDDEEDDAWLKQD